MFHIGQLVLVKSLSPRNYLGMITKTVLYLDSFENAFYEVYLIDTREHVKRMVAEGALLKFIESLENYPDPDDPREQILMDEMLKIVIERFNEIGRDDDGIFDAD